MILESLLIGGVSLAANAFAAYKKGEISEEEYRQAVVAANELERQLKSLRPDDTWESINPELLSEAAKYSPEIAAFVQENAPQLIQEPQSATEKRVQRQALQTLAAQAETGRDVISEAQREQALFESDARAKARQAQLMEALRRQGALGSGAGLVAQLQAEQEEARAAREESLRGTQEAELRRRQALGQAASLAGQIREQNLQVESANVGTMNAYNARLANARNLYNQYAANERNRAQAINQQREIERNRYNVELSNKYAMYNREQQLAAKERARRFDVDLANRMFDIRQGAESRRAQGKREFAGDIATSVSSGLGTGMAAYGALSSAGANAAKQIFWESAKQGLARGGGEALGYSAVRNAFAPAQADEINMPAGQINALAEEIQNPMPVPQAYDWRDEPEALDELGNVDWRKMQARIRRNKRR